MHGSVAADPVLSRRHRSFIAAHFASGLLALGLLPLCLAFEGGVASLSTAVTALLGLELLVAAHVSRTGRLADGYLLSAFCLSAVIATMAIATGGVASFAVVWFAIAPVEAALSSDRRVIGGAAAIGAAGFLLVAVLSLAGALPTPVASGTEALVLNAVSGMIALGYAGGIAMRVESRHAFSQRVAEAGEERYRLLAATMTDLVTCHGGDGSVTFVSPVCERMLTVRGGELMGEGLFRRVHVADRPAYLTAISTAIHKGAASVEFRLRVGDLDEPESWMWVESMMRRSDEGGTFGGLVVAVTRDIARHKMQEEELSRARQEAETASFAKTRFLANVSHELRTPLNAIIGFSDILGQEIFGRFEYERHREYARLIKESGEHLLQVVNDILDMSKIEAGSFDVTPEPFDLFPIVDRVCALMQPQADAAGVRLSLAVDEGLPELCADRRACRQILLNLVSNAIKFTDRGGEVTCGARLVGRKVALYVRDTGIGIAPEDLPRLGTPFVQADSGYDRRRAGTGLGLSVVKGLAVLHGGVMSIDSAVGVGTTVTVTLPAHLDREQPVTIRPARRGEGESPAYAAKRA